MKEHFKIAVPMIVGGYIFLLLFGTAVITVSNIDCETYQKVRGDYIFPVRPLSCWFTEPIGD